MQPSFWQERWQQNQIGFHQEAINLHLQQFWPKLGIAPGHGVFVPLCGKSADMLWLRAQGYTVVGVELSPLAVQAFFAENGLPVTTRTQGRFTVYEAEGICIYCGDFFDLTADALEGVGAVYDRASLIALPPDMRPAYAAHLQRLLVAGSSMLLVAFDYPQQEMQGPPFSVEACEVRALYGDHCSIELIHSADILQQEARFRDRGVTRLQEKVYRLTYHPAQEPSCAS